jgi:CobQ-like glutamine amidotransferase family enzyme
MKNKLYLNWLFPDLLNLYGDRGNILALQNIAELFKIETEVIRVNEKSDFREDGILLIPSGEFRVIKSILEHHNWIKEIIQKSKKVIVIGASCSLLFTETKLWGKPGFKGLGLVQGEVIEKDVQGLIMKVPLGGDILIKVTPGETTPSADGCHPFRTKGNWVPASAGMTNERVKHPEVAAVATLPRNDGTIASDSVNRGCDDAKGYEVAGCYVRPYDVNVEEEYTPLGEVEVGIDNSGKLVNAGPEGLVKGNILWTNILGPVLVKNPWLTVEILNEVLDRREAGDSRCLDSCLRRNDIEWELELQSLEAFKKFVHFE